MILLFHPAVLEQFPYFHDEEDQIDAAGMGVKSMVNETLLMAEYRQPGWPTACLRPNRTARPIFSIVNMD